MHKSILIAFIPRFFSMFVANANLDYNTVCNGLTCETNEQCLIRKFWCDYTVCPQMIYCAKSRSESLRGPETCESVICPVGYTCVLQVHECVWNQGCKQRFARCISDAEFADEPATCADVRCEKGHHCILRETHYCPRPPCRLTKSCAYSKDVEIWFDKCRQLGCNSEHECFLRRPPQKCATSSCGHIPDCLVTPDTFESTSSTLCHGWICPTDQVCSARLPASCGSPGVNCPILRSCRLPDLTQRADVRTTLTDIERDLFLEEQRRLQQYRKPSFTSNFTQTEIQRSYDDIYPIAGQSRKNPEDAASSSMKSRLVSVSPIMRSTSQNSGDSAWLTYLKRRAGAMAVQYWIDKAKSNQDYEGFIDWLDTVAELLDPDTYRLWLMEVESASANVPEFQAWISPRNLAAHRLAAAAASATQRTLPVSIADRAKNLFYSDKSLVFADQRQEAESGGGAIRQSSNFKFNEASQLGDGPLAHLEIPFQPQGPSDVDYRLPQDFGEAVKNSWKSSQSYYQLKPPSPSGFAGQSAQTLHLANNYTRAHQNASVPQMFFMDDRYATTLKRENDDVAARSFGAMTDQIGDFKNFRPNAAKLDPNQSASQLMFSSTPKDDEHLPNLLIYFPPPLSFFIYYSIGSHNHTGNISLQTGDEDDSDSKFEIGTRMFNSGRYIPEDYDDNPNFYDKSGPMDKQKEFEFIRKIIRELINYWDDEERSFGKPKDGNVGVRMGNMDENLSHIINTQSDEIKPNGAEGKPTLNIFLEWLYKNGHINSTQLSELNSRRENLSIEPELGKQNFGSPDFRNPESNQNSTAGKIRILVDIDKNPEIMKKLFSRNNTDNKNDSDSRRYQVTVNLNEYADSKEEDVISKKLINIASKQLHRNITGEGKIPKVLWVFPVYENEENETIINEIKKRSKEKVNTLKDVDAATGHTDNNDGSHYTSNNPGVNGGKDNAKDVENVDNTSSTDDSKKDAEEEYYDDQEMYDEDEYGQDEITESMGNGSSKK